MHVIVTEEFMSLMNLELYHHELFITYNILLRMEVIIVGGV